jgi:hypothetical protein
MYIIPFASVVWVRPVREFLREYTPAKTYRP